MHASLPPQNERERSNEVSKQDDLLQLRTNQATKKPAGSKMTAANLQLLQNNISSNAAQYSNDPMT